MVAALALAELGLDGVKLARAVPQTDELGSVVDRGYDDNEILACEEAGITATQPASWKVPMALTRASPYAKSRVLADGLKCRFPLPRITFVFG